MRKIFLVHFQPLERYPPVVNLIRYLAAENKKSIEIHVISTEPDAGQKLLEVDGIIIHRLGTLNKQMNRWQRILFYKQFTSYAFRLLRNHKPQKVLYYETISAGAPYLYKKWSNRKCDLFIHYHEYSSPEEYKSGMLLTRYLYYLEKKLFKSTTWVSHTNAERLNLFIRDLGNDAPPHTYTMPNYPPISWKAVANPKRPVQDNRTGFVYVGALGLETMYVKEFAGFIKERQDHCYWDIYSDNFSAEILDYFENLNASNIHFKGSVEYDTLPEILPRYDVGVILYKGHIPNYIYNAPNKLFEYLACGLDVWFPGVMKSCVPYVTSQTYPAVLEVDFSDLQSFQIAKTLHKEGYEFKGSEYFCERVYQPLAMQLFTYA